MTVKAAWWFGKSRPDPFSMDQWESFPEVTELAEANSAALLELRCSECRTPVLAVYRSSRQRLLVYTPEAAYDGSVQHQRARAGRAIRRLDRVVGAVYLLERERFDYLGPIDRAVLVAIDRATAERTERLAFDATPLTVTASCPGHGPRKVSCVDLWNWLKSGTRTAALGPSTTMEVDSDTLNAT